MSQGTYLPTNSPLSNFQQYPSQTVPGQPGGADSGQAATGIQHHYRYQQDGFRQLVNEGEQELERGFKMEEAEEDLPGSGPGGVLQKYYQMDFKHFFEEDEGTKTFHLIYKVLELVYKYTKLAIYHLFVVLVGIPLTIMWALFNGFWVFFLVWLYGPFLKLTIISTRALLPLYVLSVQFLLTPMVDALGRFFSHIRVRAVLGGSVGLGGVKRGVGQEHLA